MKHLTAGMLILFGAFVAPGGLARAADDLDLLLARTLATYGLTADALPEKGTLLRTRGRISSSSRSRDGEILREAVWPDFLRVQITFADGNGETRLMKKDRGWRDGAPAPVPLVKAMRLQLARLSLPMILEWERRALTDLGPATRNDGRVVRRLRLTLGEEMALFVEIEAATGRVLRSAGVMRMGGAEMSFGAAYSDFRRYGQLMWPAREDQSAMGQPIGWTVIDLVEPGLPFDESRARP